MLFNARIVKSFASKPIPFANQEKKWVNAIARESKRLMEAASNSAQEVLHVFSLAISEVRKAGTSERRNALQ